MSDETPDDAGDAEPPLSDDGVSDNVSRGEDVFGHRRFIDGAMDGILGAGPRSHSPLQIFTPVGCLWVATVVVGILILAVFGLQLLAGIFADAGDDVGATPTEPDQVVVDEVGGSGPAPGSNDLAFLPRSGVYEIENMPFLPECGPGDLGSGFEEGTIEVAEDGRSLTASGSSPGTASFEMQLVDQTPDRLSYVGIESFTGIELTFVFTSPTTLEANVRSTGNICIERPAVGEWDREVGEPDPDAPPDVDLPSWVPPNFPMGDTRTIDVEENDGGTFTVVFEDTDPVDVLFILDEWADTNGHVVASFAPGRPEDDPDDGSMVYTAVVELADGRTMDVEIVDLGNFDTRLTATIRSG